MVTEPGPHSNNEIPHGWTHTALKEPQLRQKMCGSAGFSVFFSSNSIKKDFQGTRGSEMFGMFARTSDSSMRCF